MKTTKKEMEGILAQERRRLQDANGRCYTAAEAFRDALDQAESTRMEWQHEKEEVARYERGVLILGKILEDWQ